MKKQSIIYLAVFLVLYLVGTALALNIDADSNDEVQFNDGGVMGADSDLTYNKTTKVLTAVKVAASGTDTRFTCVSADAQGDVDAVGDFCMDSNDTGTPFYYWNDALRTVANLDQAQTFTNKTYVDFMVIEAMEFTENLAITTTHIDFSPYTHAYGDAFSDSEPVEVVTENTPQIYSTVGGGSTDILMTIHDDDATGTGMEGVVNFKPDLVGMGATTGLKVRWHAVITHATNPSAETIIFRIWGGCVADGGDIDGVSVGTPQSVTVTSSDATDDWVTSDWQEIGTNAITGLGSDFTCLIGYNRDYADTYGQDVGFVKWEIAFQRTMPAWATVTGAWGQ
jgi:hypothetical protein